MEREIARWHIYILRVDNHGRKMLNGREWCYYTGITQRGIGVRFGDHLTRRGHSWLNTMCRGASRIPVYVEHFNGDLVGALKRERDIKRLSQEEKTALINSAGNCLVGYKPLAHIIIRNEDGTESIEMIK